MCQIELLQNESDKTVKHLLPEETENLCKGFETFSRFFYEHGLPTRCQKLQPREMVALTIKDSSNTQSTVNNTFYTFFHITQIQPCSHYHGGCCVHSELLRVYEAL